MNTILEQEIAKIPERVARGIDAQVKEYGFEFFNMIDLDILDIEGGDCIVCQLKGTWNFLKGEEYKRAVSLGFIVSSEINCTHNKKYYAPLTAEWKKQITMWRERLKELENIKIPSVSGIPKTFNVPVEGGVSGTNPNN